MKKEISKNKMAISLTLFIFTFGFLSYVVFADSFTAYINSYKIKYYHYKPKENFTVKETSNLPNPKSVPILVYHGITKKEDEENTTLENFRAQMEALKKEGYETISIEDFYQFRENNFKLPKKPIILTFDDGRKDSFYPTDSILKYLGFKATIFVATGPMLDGNDFYLNEKELKEMHASSIWEIEAHGRNSHKHINIELKTEPNQKDQRFLSSKLFLKEQNRFETNEEFKKRIENDYIDSNEDIKKITGKYPKYLAIPLDDFGLSENTNFTESEKINYEIIKKYYLLSFIQSNNTKDVEDVLYSFYNHANEDPYQIRRFEVKNIKAEKLIALLEKYHPSEIDFSLKPDNLNGISKSRISGNLTSENDQIILKTNLPNRNGTFTIGEIFWKNYTSTLTIEKNNSRSASVIVLYKDWNNFTYCGFDNNTVFIREMKDGITKNISKPKFIENKIKDVNTITVKTIGNFVSCSLNDEPIFNQISSSFKNGGAGVFIWNAENLGQSIIKSFVVKAN